MGSAERKSIRAPDETKSFDKGRCDLVHVGAMTLGRSVLEPGWRWSESIGRIAGTERCEITHTGVVVSGRLHFALSDGSEIEAGPDDAFSAPPGHDAWVVGNEPCEVLDFASNLATYETPFEAHVPAPTAEAANTYAHATANPPPMPAKS